MKNILKNYVSVLVYLLHLQNKSAKIEKFKTLSLHLAVLEGVFLLKPKTMVTINLQKVFIYTAIIAVISLTIYNAITYGFPKP